MRPPEPSGEIRLRLDRFLIGLRGLGLLRGWPFGDPAEAQAQLDAIAEMLAARDEPPMSDAFVVDHADHGRAYAEWSESYDEPGNALIMAEEPVVRSILEAEPVGVAVDVACGTGRLAGILAALGHDVIGVDPSEAMLARARDKVPGARFLTGGFDELPVEDASAHVVTCALALVHVPDLHPAIREIARVVRPGGLVVLTDIHPIATATGAQAIYPRPDGSRGLATNHLHWVSDYVRAFGEAGLVIERCEEPLVTDVLFEQMGSPDVRAAAETSLRGLPLALIWALRRPPVDPQPA